MIEVEKILEALIPRPQIEVLEPTDLDLEAKEDAFDFIEQVKILGEDPREWILKALAKAQRKSPAQGLKKLLDDTVSGRRKAIELPSRQLSLLSQALLPATVTLVCGSPGSSKSFYVLQNLSYWLDQGVPCCVYEMEDDKPYHLSRVLAQRSGCSDLTDSLWVKEHPTETKRAFSDHEAFLDKFGEIVSQAPDKQVTHDELIQWVRRQCDAGKRIIVVDPVTAVEQADNPWKADAKFLDDCKKEIRKTGASLILVTHPTKQRKSGKPSMDDLAGGAAYQRFAHTIFWIEKLKEPRVALVKTLAGRDKIQINRIIHISKARNGRGAGLRLGYVFDASNLLFAEQGILVKE